MITEVKDGKELNEFVYFVKKLYKNDGIFVNPIFYSLKKELKNEIFIKKHSTAILCSRDGKTVGRLLFCIDKSKQKGCDIGYFSFFDCIDDAEVAKELFSYMENALKGKVGCAEGTFSPFDPDTRRGILVRGFDQPHTIFTSYNFPYYGGLLEKLGYAKAYDTYTIKVDLGEKAYGNLCALNDRVAETKNVRIDDLDPKHIDKDIADVEKIFAEATFELNYQEAPSAELIRSAARGMKLFLDPALVKIARENGTGRPIGFSLVLKDYNEIFKKTGGKLNPFVLLFDKNNIKGARGTLQYVVPDYQKTGLICMIYKATYDSLRARGITYFEGGTIMEDNVGSWKTLVRFGGNISKVYRIYNKTI